MENVVYLLVYMMVITLANKVESGQYFLKITGSCAISSSRTAEAILGLFVLI